jgi:ADP-heptose:LPS heptosyltransferase
LEILHATGVFSEVLFYVPPSGNRTALIHAVSLAIKIRRLRPEALFYLRDLPWNHVRRDRFFFEALCGVSRSFGLGNSYEIFGSRDASGRLLRFPSEVERLLKIVAEGGVTVPAREEVDFAVPISSRDRVKVDSLWREAGIPAGGLVIGIGPGSKMPAKRWPLERFRAVGKTLLGDFPDCRLVIFGGPEDRPLGEEMRRALAQDVVNLAGRLSVLETAEALRRCCIYVGNDMGVMHLAAAVGTPCVGIFSGRDHPGRWEPYGNGHIVLRKEPACAGCLLQVCIEREMVCLGEIVVSEVVGAVHQILGPKYGYRAQVARQ